MPSREDIDSFKEILNSLGSEPEILAGQGEAIREVPPSEETGPAPAEEEPLGSLDSLLGLEEPAAPEAGAEAPEEAPARPAPAEAPVPEELTGLDFGSLFGEEGEPGAFPEIPSEAPGGLPAEPGAPAEPAAGEEAPSPTLEEPPSLEPSAFSQDIERMETLPPDLGDLSELGEPGGLGEAGELGEAAEPGGPAGEEAPSEAPAFELPEAEPGPFEVPGEGPAAEAPEELAPSAGEEFALPSFEAGQPEEGPPGETAPEAAEVPGEGESLELPSFEEMPLPEEAEAPPGEAGEPAPFEAEAPEAPPEAPGEEVPLPEGLGGEGFPAEAPPEPAAGEAPEAEGIGEQQLPDELGLDEFTLPESVEEFGIPQKPAAPARPQRPAPAAAPRRPAAAPPPEPMEELGGAEVEVELNDEQFRRLKRCLDSLPRNVKIAVQDVIAEGKGSAADIGRLITLLVEGAAPAEIAALASKISGKRLRLPAGFEKKTGVAFEEERRTFGYALRENILPLVRVFLLSAVALALVAFVAYRFVYRPLFAYTNYERGYQDVQDNRYSLGNQRFARATAVWPMKSWFYRYAEGFAAKRQFLLAEEKYDQLLRIWPGDHKGILDYARMETTALSAFKRADDLLRIILDTTRGMYDYEALLASGDNQLAWAEDVRDQWAQGSKPAEAEALEAARREVEQTVNGHLEQGRLAYASLMERYGQKDDLLFRMLRYFVRTDNEREAERLRAYFAGRKDVKVDAEVYAELAGYFIDKGRLDWVQNVLVDALKAASGLPEIHYELARYYKIVKKPEEEKKALDAAIALMARGNNVLTRGRLAMEVDSRTRLGQYYYAASQYLDAEREYSSAIKLVEESQKRKLIGGDPVFGQPYYDLGDLLYYVEGDLNGAFTDYMAAAQNGFASPEMDYKIGYVYYAQQRYQEALVSFTRAADALSPARIPWNLLYAAGNAFYQRADFFSAQGSYLRLLDILDDRAAAAGRLQPREQSDHATLVEYLLRVNNNLGVTVLKLSERTGDRRKRSVALAYLATATEQYDMLARDPEALRRMETQNLPSLNMRGSLYPSARFDPQIYALIPKDFEATF